MTSDHIRDIYNFEEPNWIPLEQGVWFDKYAVCYERVILKHKYKDIFHEVHVYGNDSDDDEYRYRYIREVKQKVKQEVIYE